MEYRSRERKDGKEDRPLDDVHLLALLAQDLDRHFGQLVGTYQNRLYTFMLRQTGSAQDTEDIVQEALMQAYFALTRYSAERIHQLALRPWLYKITLNVFYSRLRKARLHLVSLDMSEEGPHLTIEDEDTPEAVWEGRETYRELASLVKQLPDKHRSAVNLYYFEGLSYLEIADLLNVPVGSVKSYLYRGIRRLRRALVTQQEEGR